MSEETFASHSRKGYFTRNADEYRPQFQSDAKRVQRLKMDAERKRTAKGIIRTFGLKLRKFVKNNKAVWVAIGRNHRPHMSLSRSGDYAHGSSRVDAALNYQLAQIDIPQVSLNT